MYFSDKIIILLFLNINYYIIFKNSFLSRLNQCISTYLNIPFHKIEIKNKIVHIYQIYRKPNLRMMKISACNNWSVYTYTTKSSLIANIITRKNFYPKER